MESRKAAQSEGQIQEKREREREKGGESTRMK